MRALASFASMLVTLSCGTALAQVRGVPVEALTPAGMHLVDVDVPEVDRVPVRLRFAPAPQGRAEVLVDVLLEDDAPSAGAAAAWFRETVSGELPAIAGIGDAAVGDAGLVAFVRDDVLVVVRRIAGAHDVSSIARSIARAIDPARSAGGPHLAVAPRDPQVGETIPIHVAGALALHVTADGPAQARRTRSGWVLSRSGAGPITLRVVIVDRLVRRSERVVTLP